MHTQYHCPKTADIPPFGGTVVWGIPPLNSSVPFTQSDMVYPSGILYYSPCCICRICHFFVSLAFIRTSIILNIVFHWFSLSSIVSIMFSRVTSKPSSLKTFCPVSAHCGQQNIIYSDISTSSQYIHFADSLLCILYRGDLKHPWPESHRKQFTSPCIL